MAECVAATIEEVLENVQASYNQQVQHMVEVYTCICMYNFSEYMIYMYVRMCVIYVYTVHVQCIYKDSFPLGTRAQEGYGTHLVCLLICLSVCPLPL